MGEIKQDWEIDPNIVKLLDAAVIGISIATPSGDIVYANPRLLELFQTTKDKFVGRNAKEFYAHPEMRDKIIDQLSKYSYVKDEEVELVRDDGTHYTASLSFQLTQFAGNNHYFCNFFDLTHRIEMEQKLIEQRIELFEKRHYEEIAKLASKTAHEINNPLTIIKGMLMVMDGEVNANEMDRDRLQYLLDKSQDAITRIADGVEELRRVSNKKQSGETLRVIRKPE